MSDRQVGWYHVRTGLGPECAKWDGKHWIIAGSMHSYDDSDFVGIGGRIPAPDEPWQTVPVEPTTRQVAAGIEAYDGKCEKSYRAMLAAAPKPGGE